LTRQDTPEKAARRRIDAALDAAGWQVQHLIEALDAVAGTGPGTEPASRG
jgi:type I site-specific restriction endonuclease